MVPPQTMTIYSTLINKSTQKACGCTIKVSSSERYVSAGPSEDERIAWCNYDRHKPTFSLGDRQHLALRRACCGIYDAPADSPAAVWFYRMEGTDWDRTAKGRLSQMHERDTWRSTAMDPNGRTLDTQKTRSAVFNRGTKHKRAYSRLAHTSQRSSMQILHRRSPPLATTYLHLHM